MKQAILAGLLGLGCASLAVSCASSDPNDDEELGSISEEVATKCNGAALNSTSYCQPTCKCNYKEGDCDSDADCSSDVSLGQLFCAGKITYFYGGTTKGEVCAPAHCRNNIKDFNESQVDCGGDCGLNCPDQCAGLPANGQSAHCTTTCPCGSGQGGCDENNAECQSGNYCASNVGTFYGFVNTTDICLANTCRNGVKDAGEDGVDCGPTCLPCSGGATLALAQGGSSAERGYDIAIDSADTITIAGSFSGSVNFGAGNQTASGGSDIFIAKYNNVGSHVWSKRIGGSMGDGDLNVSVAVDASRNVYLAGNYRGTIDLGGATLTAVSLSDAFVAKYNPSGVLLWSKSYGSAGQAAVTINSLRVAPSGHVYVAGAFASPTLLLGSTTLTNQGPNGTWDGFVLKLNTNGTPVWSTSFGADSNDQATNVATDASSTPYISCTFVGNVAGMAPLGNQEGCLMQLSSTTGAITWARRLAGTGADSATSVAVDANGPVVSGWFRSAITFDDNSTATTSVYGAYVVAYNPSGTFRWKKAYTSTNGRVRAMASAGGAQGVISLGDFTGTTTFDTAPVPPVNGGRNGWLVRYDTAGNVVKSMTFGDPNATPLGAQVASNMLGITGEFQGTINLQGTSKTITSVGGNDIFAARLVY